MFSMFYSVFIASVFFFFFPLGGAGRGSQKLHLDLKVKCRVSVTKGKIGKKRKERNSLGGKLGCEVVGEEGKGRQLKKTIAFRIPVPFLSVPVTSLGPINCLFLKELLSSIIFTELHCYGAEIIWECYQSGKV